MKIITSSKKRLHLEVPLSQHSTICQSLGCNKHSTVGTYFLFKYHNLIDSLPLTVQLLTPRLTEPPARVLNVPLLVVVGEGRRRLCAHVRGAVQVAAHETRPHQRPHVGQHQHLLEDSLQFRVCCGHVEVAVVGRYQRVVGLVALLQDQVAQHGPRLLSVAVEERMLLGLALVVRTRLEQDRRLKITTI